MVVTLFCLDQMCPICRASIAEAGYMIEFGGGWYSVVSLDTGSTVLPLHRGYSQALTHVEEMVEHEDTV